MDVALELTFLKSLQDKTLTPEETAEGFQRAVIFMNTLKLLPKQVKDHGKPISELSEIVAIPGGDYSTLYASYTQALYGPDHADIFALRKNDFKKFTNRRNKARESVNKDSQFKEYLTSLEEKSEPGMLSTLKSFRRKVVSAMSEGVIEQLKLQALEPWLEIEKTEAMQSYINCIVKDVLPKKDKLGHAEQLVQLSLRKELQADFEKSFKLGTLEYFYQVAVAKKEVASYQASSSTPSPAATIKTPTLSPMPLSLNSASNSPVLSFSSLGNSSSASSLPRYPSNSSDNLTAMLNISGLDLNNNKSDSGKNEVKSSKLDL